MNYLFEHRETFPADIDVVLIYKKANSILSSICLENPEMGAHFSEIKIEFVDGVYKMDVLIHDRENQDVPWSAIFQTVIVMLALAGIIWSHI